MNLGCFWVSAPTYKSPVEDSSCLAGNTSIISTWSSLKLPAKYEQVKISGTCYLNLSYIASLSYTALPVLVQMHSPAWCRHLRNDHRVRFRQSAKKMLRLLLTLAYLIFNQSLSPESVILSFICKASGLLGVAQWT